MSDRRITIRFIRRAVLAATLSCSSGSVSSAADPVPSREYPSTYSSRKAPWYDPFRIFTSAPTATEPKTTPTENAFVPVPMPAPMFRQPGPAEDRAPAPMFKLPSRTVAVPASKGLETSAPNTAPAWKWYGYGTPSHNAFANAPTTWHTTAGATPGAVPQPKSPPDIQSVSPSELAKPIGPIVLPQPVQPESPLVVVPPTEGPKLPGTVAPPPSTSAADVNWKSSPGASLRLPRNEALDIKPGAPHASLRKPVLLEEKPITPSPPSAMPDPRVSPPSNSSKDILVVPAPGITVPN